MPLELFYSYSHKDADLRFQLETHLAQLARNGQIHPWHDRCIQPGDEWRNQIDEHVHSAHIILLLISPDFLASDYCYDVEMKVALERHGKAQAIVIPIILRPVDWGGSPFAHLQALPQDAKAITLWPDRDQALADVARAIRDVAVRYQQPVVKPLPLAGLADQQVAHARMLDAAMPSHIVKDRATELLVLIRLPESTGLAGVLQGDEEAEAKPEDVRSKAFEVTFPLGPKGQPQPLKVCVQLTAPDFAVPTDRKNLFVPVNRDSEVCPFVLTPMRTGSLLVVIELLWEDAERGYRRLKTNCVAEAEMVGSPVMSVVQMPLVVGSPVRTGGYPPRTPLSPRPTVLEIIDRCSLERTSVNPPAPPEEHYPAVPPAPASSPAKTTFSSSPYVRTAAALCLLTLGGTFFVFQRTASRPPSSMSPMVPSALSVGIAAQVNSASLEFQAASKRALKPQDLSPTAKTEIPPKVAAEIKIGQENLAAARAALAAGRTAEAQKHLELVRAASLNLTRLEPSKATH